MVSDQTASVVYVEWLDSYGPSEGTWVSVADFTGERWICRSVGFVVDENEDYLILAGHIGSGGHLCAGGLSIPKCAITRRKVLKGVP